MRLLRSSRSDTACERLWSNSTPYIFLRHSAEEIAWHPLAALPHLQQPARPRPPHQLLPRPGQVMVYTRTSRTCSPASSASSPGRLQHRRRQDPTTALWLRAGRFRWCWMSKNRENEREMVPYIEHELEKRLLRNCWTSRQAAGYRARPHFPIKPEAAVGPTTREPTSS